MPLTSYFEYYNTERPHQALGYRTPDQVYATGQGGGARIVVNLQFINADGEKRFLKGGRKAGCFWWVGDYPQSDAATICLAEGFATAASLHEATGHRCYLAFDAGNLPAVAEAIRQEHPKADIVVCADHDLAGLKYGGRAAHAIGARLTYPEIDGQDFNDVLHQGGGDG